MRSLEPLAFMIYFGGRETAEIFLKDFIENCTYGNKIKHLYNELVEMEDKNKIDLNFNEFANASKIKLAFINGVRI